MLGFYSRVDAVDLTPGFTEDFYWSSSLDLFRYSATSLAQGAGVPDMTANSLNKYFSVDGGSTSLVDFSTGAVFGDGFQATHWKFGADGLMIPFLAPEQFLEIKDLDLAAFDVIGWDLVTSVPEPGTCLFLILGMAGLAVRRSKR